MVPFCWQYRSSLSQASLPSFLQGLAGRPAPRELDAGWEAVEEELGYAVIQTAQLLVELILSLSSLIAVRGRPVRSNLCERKQLLQLLDFQRALEFALSSARQSHDGGRAGVV